MQTCFQYGLLGSTSNVIVKKGLTLLYDQQEKKKKNKRTKGPVEHKDIENGNRNKIYMGI